MNRSVLALVLLATGCLAEVDVDRDVEDPETGTIESEITGTNRLAANRLAANRLAANRLAANRLAANSLETKQLMDSLEGRDVMSFIVGCALPAGESLTLTTTAGEAYSFPGQLNLAPAWATRAPTVSERRWVTACLLARTNLYGVPVTISLRHDANVQLATTTNETSTYSSIEGAFYGDLFATTPVLYACASQSFVASSSQAVESLRACTRSSDGTKTQCDFTFTGHCGSSVGARAPACIDRSPPYNGCVGGGVSYSEVISSYLVR